jgi:hypothetical protein
MGARVWMPGRALKRIDTETRSDLDHSDRLPVCVGGSSSICPHPFWFDEIFTEAVAGLPTVSDFQERYRLWRPPPLTAFLTRLAHNPFGSGELVARLPEIGLWAHLRFAFSYLYVAGRMRYGPSWRWLRR